MKYILITGCSSGIGRCIADGLRARNYNVIVTVRKKEDLKGLNKAGFNVVMLDLTDSKSIYLAAEYVLKQSNGQIYGLINNAAYGLTGAVEDLPTEALRHQFETNVFGTQELTNLLIPSMRKNNSGRIIQISSVLGLVTMKYRGAYCASKYALESLSDAMRYELADTKIKVSLIEPGPIKSEFRNNVVANFQKVIDKNKSVHGNAYNKMEGQAGDKVPFTLGPEAVLKKVIQALESEKPKARYYVTFPTILFAFLKRILPGTLLDKILVRV
ncbi:MAG TPA: SDR family NAD(P)-dependent oxidoreductase [Thiotrichaceae bacterium]|jgi:short-subunit dehydrogenase|nr:SDR family NAD(P)-dependent oxidoreductase [Thiotrichaceae bacterium]HIM09096.1 SDR family NAD(P)-dependent oxidoreductase [Gammaproteobacteria bacterium]